MLVFDHETTHYKVTATLEEVSLPTVHALFGTFFQFVAYPNTTLTLRKQTDQGIHYEFASFSTQGRGFYCEVDFIAEAAGSREEEHQREPGETSKSMPLMRSASGLQPNVKWTFKVDGASLLPLIAAQGIVYIADEERYFYALDAEQGTVRWQWEANRVSSLPEVDNGVLSVPVRSSRNTALYAIAVQSGQILKTFPIPTLQFTGFNTLTVHDGVAYLSGVERTTPLSSPEQHALCLAIDLETEEQKWRVDLGEQATMILTPVVMNARVYLTAFDSRNRHERFGYLYALDARTGEEMWRHQFESGRAQPSVVAGTEVFVFGRTLEVLDASTGILQWNLPDLKNIVVNGPLTVNDEMIFISYEQSSSDAGKEVWKRENETILRGGPPLLGEIMAVDRASRQTRWKVTLAQGQSFIEKPMISDGVLYTTWRETDIRWGTKHATLFALDVQTGQEYWRFEADDLSAPLVVNDMVFMRGREGEEDCIYALSCP
ncbi:MAG: PQQ-binding-like beta-propeller repeat protein [Ktedonobacteraceae bacterium]|nr:PQQ-binding-like beta-propeller repeat protein [Ktedonobacteraceae bacterium]